MNTYSVSYTDSTTYSVSYTDSATYSVSYTDTDSISDSSEYSLEYSVEIVNKMDAKNLMMPGGIKFIDYLKNNAIDNEYNDLEMNEWTLGYETCKYRLAKILLPQIESAENSCPTKGERQ